MVEPMKFTRWVACFLGAGMLLTSLACSTDPSGSSSAASPDATENVPTASQPLTPTNDVPASTPSEVTPADAADAVDAAEPADDAIRENWADAGGLIGSSTTICGPVAGLGVSARYAFVNVGVDYPDPSRFTFLLPRDAYTDLEATNFLGGTVCGMGEIYSYEGLPQIELTGADELFVP